MLIQKDSSELSINRIKACQWNYVFFV